MTAVQEALAYAREVPQIDLAQVEYEAEELSRRAGLLLPVERDTKLAIEHRMGVLKHETEVTLFAKKVGLRLLSKEVLGWRNRKDLFYRTEEKLRRQVSSIPVPMLALINVAWSKPVLGWSGSSYTPITPDLPDDLLKCYDDVNEALNLHRARAEERLSMYFTFTGVIPIATREKIKKARSTHFNDVFLLCDAPLNQWGIDREPIPRVVDPIVVGHACKELWVIDIFEPTSIEEYISLEFTSVPALGTTS